MEVRLNIHLEKKKDLSHHPEKNCKSLLICSSQPKTKGGFQSIFNVQFHCTGKVCKLRSLKITENIS